jgi:serine/threonine protein phosphatase PrpC
MNRLKKKEKKVDAASETTKTVPLNEQQILGLQSETTFAIYPKQYIVGAAQSVGRQRDHNEDTILTFNSNLADGTKELAFGLYIVADGMGGHQHGEVASSLAAKALANHVFQTLYQPMLLSNDELGESLFEVLELGIKKAQNAVIGQVPGGGTTLTGALIIGDRVLLVHVGDSRAYFIHPSGYMQLLTHDHSYVQRLLDLGSINAEEAAVHPQRNVLYRAIGQPEPFSPDIESYTFPAKGLLLICSDGLWGLVSDKDMNRIIRNAPDLTTACNHLVEAANMAGGPDNISVVLAKIY